MPGNNFPLGLRVLCLKAKLLVYKERKKNDRQDIQGHRGRRGRTTACFNLDCKERLSCVSNIQWKSKSGKDFLFRKTIFYLSELNSVLTVNAPCHVTAWNHIYDHIWRTDVTLCACHFNHMLSLGMDRVLGPGCLNSLQKQHYHRYHFLGTYSLLYMYTSALLNKFIRYLLSPFYRWESW